MMCTHRPNQMYNLHLHTKYHIILGPIQIKSGTRPLTEARRRRDADHSRMLRIKCEIYLHFSIHLLGVVMS